MVNNKKEYILCSAIHIDDGIEHIHQPKNIKTGFVVCGRRHHNCFRILALIDKALHIEGEQGFLTSKDNFVLRDEAEKIALDAGQLEEDYKITGTIYSEDLW